MNKVILTVLLFFSFFSTHAQTSLLKRNIKWENSKSVSYYYTIEQKDLNRKDYLNFENAYYYDYNDMQPYYFELIPISSSDANIQIIQQKYENLSNSEIKMLGDLSKITSELQYSKSVKYARNKAFLQLSILPFRKNNTTGQYEKLVDFEIRLTESTKKTHPTGKSFFSSSSVLKSGTWIKIRIKNDGLYKISYSELINMGFSNPENIRIFGNSEGMLPVSNTETYQDDLMQNSVYFEKGTDGIFNSGDYLLFYAKGPDKWTYDSANNFFNCTKHIYSDYNYFFLTTNAGSIQTINNASAPVGVASETITSFTDYAHYEKEEENLIESGQEWYGENFDITTNYNFSFDFPNLISSDPVKAKIALVARSSVNSSYTIKANNQTFLNPSLGSVNMSSYTSTYAVKNISDGSFSSTSDNININIEYNKPTSSSEGWLDYITLNAKRKLQLSDVPLEFRYYNSETNSKIIEFKISNISSATKIWNLTNTYQPENISNISISGNELSFKVEVEPGLNEFIAFNNSDFNTAELVGIVENQNLHATNHKDMIIISHPDFISQANEIKQIHEDNDNLDVLVTTPEKIYNEFSSGANDAAAIRNFIKMVYNRPSATDTLKYVLFIGDGSYDHRSILAKNINYVVTYQSKNSLSPVSSFVTDDFFGLLDDSDNVEAANSGLVDIGIGRLPVKTELEAQQIVEKIKTYINPDNWENWINTLCFVGDDEDNNIHMTDADKLASFVDTTYPHFFINKIYLDAFPQESSANYETYPEVNRLINDAINNGVLIFNYTGHGGENGLAHERIVSIDDINSWINSSQLPIFMTATCEFSRFDNHKYVSAGEYVLLNPNGGSIALFSTTRLVYSSPNYTLNRNFYNYVFEKNYKGENWALGDIIRLAKNASGTENNKRNFSLLGDPALKIPLPEYNVVTDSINHLDAASVTDTLKALSKVTIHGHIESNTKAPVNNYNGIVYPLVLDKQKTITTLSNDGDSPIDFLVQNNILYNGKASVTNGKFQYTFVVPKDISYNFDNGKISYFAKGTSTNAKGYFNNFIIGGSDNNAAKDNIGPNIELYMNDEGFVSGGVTDENPKLYALLADSSGINTMGSGIGHDITAILDDNSNNVILLNDYYESDIDSYQEGKIEYLFSELENGEHKLKLKVWDVYNNSSEKELDFIVAESEKLAIKNMFNYPNPFTENTAFFFDHNRPGEDMEVLIQIFTVSGKLVKTISTTINSNGFRSEPINWDGLDDFGDNIGRGVYIYQVKVRTIDGESVKKIEKLVILK